ncbi:MAG: peptidylprolyl isomerase, partial [Nitrospinales bacterium]
MQKYFTVLLSCVLGIFVAFSSVQAGEIAVIETTLGTIEFEFLPDQAPGHVKNFKTLAKSGFYNGTAFHRVIPGFMIQGGDPNTKDSDRDNDGMGGPGYQIKAEFNDTPHKRGIVSMARSQNPNSAGSQFFIVVKDSPFLDGKYTVFGRVVSGMDVADKIVAVERDNRDN